LPSPPAAQTSKLAAASLVLGILSIVPCPLLAGIPAVICGHLALGRISRSGGSLAGSGLAIAGLVMGYVSFVLLLVAFLAGLAVPVIASAVDRARETRSVMHLRQVGGICEQYAAEHGRYPASWAELRPRVADTVPSALKTCGEGEPFTYVPLATPDGAGVRVLIVDNKGYRQHRRVVLLLTDSGAVSSVLPEKDFQELLAKLKVVSGSGSDN
jgi:type II secretory pathway pseudopilin PulG